MVYYKMYEKLSANVVRVTTSKEDTPWAEEKLVGWCDLSDLVRERFIMTGKRVLYFKEEHAVVVCPN